MVWPPQVVSFRMGTKENLIASTIGCLEIL